MLGEGLLDRSIRSIFSLYISTMQRPEDQPMWIAIILVNITQWDGDMEKCAKIPSYLICTKFDCWLFLQLKLHSHRSTMPWKYNTAFKDCYRWNPNNVFIVVSFLNNHLSKKKIMLFHPKLCLWLFKLVQNGDSAPMISPNHIYQIPYQTNTISTTNKKS